MRPILITFSFDWWDTKVPTARDVAELARLRTEVDRLDTELDALDREPSDIHSRTAMYAVRGNAGEFYRMSGENIRSQTEKADRRMALLDQRRAALAAMQQHDMSSRGERHGPCRYTGSGRLV